MRFDRILSSSLIIVLMGIFGIGFTLSAYATVPSPTTEQNILGNNDFSTRILYLGVDIQDNPTGDFETGGTWLFRTGDGAQAKASVEDQVLKIEITNGGPNSWSVQVLQSPVEIEYLGIYKVSFEAWASKTRRIGLKIGGNANRNWTPYNPPPTGQPVDQSGGYSIQITTERQIYTFEFTMKQDTDQRARFEFQLGQDDGTIWIDNVKLVRIGTAEPPAPPKALGQKYWYDLVWEQNFENMTQIDESIWSFEIGNGHAQGIPGWGNAELEYYKKENAYIDKTEKALVIEAKKESVSDKYGEYSYTSARMITRGKFNMKYGRIEFKAKLPQGKGIWPALWMLGEKIGTVGWPSCGEIDVMEYLGHETNKVYGTIHGPGYSGANGIGGSYVLPEGSFTEGYHVFAVEWDPAGISWYVDDVKFFQVSRPEVEFRGDWVFDDPFFIIMNVAVGGYWPGYPDETTVFPQKMYVKYIKVYKGVTMEQIDNGSFDYPIINDQANVPDQWFLWYGSPYGMGGTAQVSWDKNNRLAEINVINTGWESWHVQFNQWVGLVQGKTYRLTFKAKSDSMRDINLKFLHPTTYALYAQQTFNVTTEWQTFTIEFTFNSPYPVANLSFELGATSKPSTGKVYIDDVELQVIQ